MVNSIYDNARYRLATAGLNWLAVELLLSAWKGAPDFIATDVSIAQIAARGNATQIGTSLPITGQFVTLDGTAQTDPVVISGVPAGETVTFFVLSLVAGTEPVLFIDEAGGLPFLSNGLDMLLQPDWALERGWFRA